MNPMEQYKQFSIEIQVNKPKSEISKGATSFGTGAETWDVMETGGFAPGLGR